MNPLRLLFSPLTEKFYISRAKEKKTPEGKPYLFATGNKTDVTQDFYHCLTLWIGDPKTGEGYSREIIGENNKYIVEIRCVRKETKGEES